MDTYLIRYVQGTITISTGTQNAIYTLYYIYLYIHHKPRYTSTRDMLFQFFWFSLHLLSPLLSHTALNLTIEVKIKDNLSTVCTCTTFEGTTIYFRRYPNTKPLLQTFSSYAYSHLLIPLILHTTVYHHTQFDDWIVYNQFVVNNTTTLLYPNTNL